jgi:predicted phosphohydrolase
MTIQYASDLHLEFRENKEFLRTNPLKPMGEILVLAGDIVPFAVLDKHADFFSYLSDNFKTTYWIPGNHEYYYFNIATKSGVLNEKIRDNIFLVNNTSILNDNVKLVFSTLWSKINTPNEWQIENSLSDFQVIKHNANRFSAAQYNQLHNESIQFLNQELLHNNSVKTLVITHHLPTFLNYPEKYKGDALNEAFAVELFDIIDIYKPDCWIYGHTHSNTPDFTIGKTQLLTNQLGYVKYNEQLLFSTNKIYNA